jgi:MFS family permease
MRAFARFHPSSIRAWYHRWRPILPVLAAEFVVLVGFGALLPVLPLYVVEQGIDLPTLGVITAGWPLAKLVAEPVFGYLADRGGRKPLMLIALVLMALFMVLPLVFRDALALFVLRFLAGVTAGMYDPAARGIIVDSTEEHERGEAFGLYSAAAMGGFLFGPVIGSVGTVFVGGFAFPFLFTGVLLVIAAVFLAIAMPHDLGRRPRVATSDSTDAPVSQAPLRALLNRPLSAAIAINLGQYCAVGVYEVLWSVYMVHLGASIEFIGLTFMLFGLPVLLFSPIAGRIVDRGHPLRYAAAACTVVALVGLAYAFATEPVAPALLGVIEATAIAFSGPALYALVARGTPNGRSSTAQGVFGASATIGTIGAALLAGVLWSMDVRYPFFFLAGAAMLAIAVGLVIGHGSASVREPAASRAAASPAEG